LEGLSRASSLVGDDEKKKIEDAHYLYGTCLVEASLMEHEFGVDDSARYLLKRAKDALGVTIEKSGALGYRTIHQQDAKAQLVLRVTCKERASAESDDEDENEDAVDDDTDEDESIAAGSGGGNESDDTEVAEGGKASNSSSSSSAMSRLRVELEGLSADGSQVLPKPQLQNASDADDPSLNAPLSTIAQVVLLAECVAVRKKQADDGLRNWEMTPYLERVLTQAKSRPIVRASATVLMTRHEKTRARTRERALLSLEDVTRSVSEVPANAIRKMRQNKKVKRDSTNSLSKIGKERMRFAFSVWFPPIHALKKELGEALISIGMVGAALKLFEEIEHWDAYISCLELLGKKQQAADVVKTRLNEEPGNAKLWCALGDATGDETCYHKAWEVSEERDARSQRTLARLCAQRNDFAQADVHWTRALTLNPLFPGAWFNCGYCRMKCEGREDDALAAFVRCAQIDPENGQAWNNVAALSMHKQKFQAARAALQEAVKHYRTSWHTWENLAIASAKTGRFVASARALMKVIELTDGARVHIPTISTLLDMCEEGRKLGPEKCEWMRDAEKWEREANKKKDATLLSLNASDDEGEASDDDEEEDWNDAACGKAAADIASFFSDFSVNDTEANTTTATATGTKFNVRDEEIDEKTGAPRIVAKIEELLEQILAKAASGDTNSGGGNNASGAPPRAMHDTAAIWHLVSRHAENCGDFASSVEAKLKVVRALDASGWRKDGNAFDAYVSAAMNWANALKKESSACTKKSVASARMLLKSAVKIAQNEGFDERATYAPLTKTFESVEEIEKSFD
jgi:tetratricopeptide (TPR) repeat protein